MLLLHGEMLRVEAQSTSDSRVCIKMRKLSLCLLKVLDLNFKREKNACSLYGNKELQEGLKN